MGIERERKFLVADRQGPWRSGSASRIDQCYLAINDRCEVRIRRRDDDCRLTIKDRRAGTERTEVEVPIDAERFAVLAELAGPRLRKTRYCYVCGDHVWEVDVFDGVLQGLILAEVEYDADEAPVLPDWLGDEVTDDERYRNAALVRATAPPDAVARDA